MKFSSKIRNWKRAVFDIGVTATGFLVLFVMLSLCLDSALDVAFAVSGVTDKLASRQALIHSGLITCLYGAGVVATMAWVMYFLIMEMTGPIPRRAGRTEARPARQARDDRDSKAEEERREYLLVGSYLPETDEYVRAWYGQGYVYKDENAYVNHPTATCYVPELSDARYTALDLVQLTGESMEHHPLVDRLFDCLDWQHPESVLCETWFMDNE